MKFGRNGALTIRTLDGANIEIHQEVEEENSRPLSPTAGKVEALPTRDHRLHDCYNQDTELSGALASGTANLFRPLAENLLKSDPFLVLADYQAYIQCQENVSALWRDANAWTRQSILNTARMGKFYSVHSIRDYCADVWSISAGGKPAAA